MDVLSGLPIPIGIKTKNIKMKQISIFKSTFTIINFLKQHN